QYMRAYAAGVHMLAFTPWPHFLKTANGDALGDFVDRVKYSPRGGIDPASYAPPQVHGVGGVLSGTQASLTWSPQVFPSAPGFNWTQWSGFRQFEVWRGKYAGFTTTDGRQVKVTTTPSASGIVASASEPYYKVLAVNRLFKRGALSDAVLLGSAPSGP